MEGILVNTGPQGIMVTSPFDLEPRADTTGEEFRSSYVYIFLYNGDKYRKKFGTFKEALEFSATVPPKLNDWPGLSLQMDVYESELSIGGED